jgi:RNA-directed DNA polymerase
LTGHLNSGSPGVDGQSMEDFEGDLKNNLYKIWNRMSSGSYFPPSVLRVEIPKSNGGVRQLGIPTVKDRIVQTAMKMVMEPIFEQEFLPMSYGFRPGRGWPNAFFAERGLFTMHEALLAARQSR